MIFRDEWSDKARIELLERWILVQSYIYYECNENVASDFDYDNNVKELFRLREESPAAYAASHYIRYFDAYEPGCTSGFELLEKVRQQDAELYRHLGVDATIAIEQKRRHI